MAFLEHIGLLSVTPGIVVMWIIALTLIYLAIVKQFEPLLLLPIGFGVLVANLPMTHLMEPGEGLLWRFYHYGVEWEIIPPLIFLGLGALTDFGPLLSQPRLIFLGAAAQAGVYVTFFVARGFGFTLEEAATIGIIGGADGPTTIFLAAKLAPHLLGACALAAYSYMALVPIIQPPIHAPLYDRGGAQDHNEEGPKSRRPREATFSPCVDDGDHFAGAAVGAAHRDVYAGQPLSGVQSRRSTDRHRSEFADEHRHDFPRGKHRRHDERREFLEERRCFHFLSSDCLHL